MAHEDMERNVGARVEGVYSGRTGVVVGVEEDGEYMVRLDEPQVVRMHPAYCRFLDEEKSAEKKGDGE